MLVPVQSMAATSDITQLYFAFFVNIICMAILSDGKHNVPHLLPPKNNFPMTSFEPPAAVKPIFF